MLFADWYIYFRKWHLETYRKHREREKKRNLSTPLSLFPLDCMKYRNLEEKNDALSTWCSVHFLRHLICTFLAVSYFHSCYKESCLLQEYQKVKYFCLLCNHKKVTLGRTLEWTSCGQHVCGQQVIVNIEFVPYLLDQPFCYFISISPFLTCLVFFGFWLLCLCVLFSPQFPWLAHFSLYFPLRYFSLHFYMYCLVSLATVL